MMRQTTFAFKFWHSSGVWLVCLLISFFKLWCPHHAIFVFEIAHCVLFRVLHCAWGKATPPLNLWESSWAHQLATAWLSEQFASDSWCKFWNRVLDLRIGFLGPLPQKIRNAVFETCFWNHQRVVLLKRFGTIRHSSPFVEIKAHMHVLCLYSPSCWQETFSNVSDFSFSVVKVRERTA